MIFSYMVAYILVTVGFHLFIKPEPAIGEIIVHIVLFSACVFVGQTITKVSQNGRQ
jgi:hypothetical protein